MVGIYLPALFRVGTYKDKYLHKISKLHYNRRIAIDFWGRYSLCRVVSPPALPNVSYSLAVSIIRADYPTHYENQPRTFVWP